MWLKAAAPKRGNLRPLLVPITTVAPDHGNSAVVVWVLAANPARFFYEASGGRKVAERIENFAGAELAELAFGWDLSSVGSVSV